MGDENSLAGTTKAHKHSALSTDGGFLETTVTGVTNLSEGSIVYGDASEIVTELNAGSEGESLKIASGVPAWGSGSGGWTAEGSASASSPQTELAVSVSDADVYQILYNVADGGGGTCSLTMRINTVATSGYKALLGNALDGGDVSVSLNNETKFLLSGGGTQRQFSGVIYVYKSDSNFDAGVQGVTFVQQGGTMDGTDPYTVNVSNGGRQSITGAISEISLLCMKDTTAVNENIEGSIQVNSLSY